MPQQSQACLSLRTPLQPCDAGLQGGRGGERQWTACKQNQTDADAC